MEAEGGRHQPIAEIGHFGGHLQRAVVDPIGDVEAEREGILSARLVTRFESPGAARGLGGDQRKARGAGKAVPSDLIWCARNRDPIALHFADDGEQQRRPAGPEGGITVPEQVPCLAILQAYKFRARGGDAGAEP